MQVSLQNVLNFVADVKQQYSPYLSGLLFHHGRKNCSAMARALSQPVKRFYKSFNNIFEKKAAIRKLLTSIANGIQTIDGLRVLTIDGTVISKIFAKNIDNLSVDYDGVIRRVTRGLSLMVAGLVTGNNIIPLDFLFWHNKTDPNGKYKTKIQLAMDLITQLYQAVEFDYIALDGAFASKEMIEFLERLGIKYSIRMPRNRNVVIDDLKKRLDSQPVLTLVRNERCKTVKGFYQGNACFFTVHKRKKRGGGWEKIFIVSNMSITAKDHVDAYNRRWTIDKSFRTQKQYLGLKDCQMLSGDKQTFHILNVFLAYSFATIKKIAKKKKSVEDVLRTWRHSQDSKKIQNIFDNND
tara:strand:- start:122 stop:1177 length:1056 start_codon:yes stop_codon:yes gene_type:complete